MRNVISREYKGLFVEDAEDELDVPKRPGQPSRPSAPRAWWGILNLLAGEDPLRFADAAGLPLRSGLNWIAWKKDEVKKQNLALQSQTKHTLR